MKLCMIDGCENKHSAKGWCHSHYNKLNTTSKTSILGYSSWMAMKRRCLDNKRDDFVWYGGRGITICDRWLGVDGFDNFISDMGTRPGKEYSIDRIDVDGNYEPSNCRWSSAYTQAQNKKFKPKHPDRLLGVIWRASRQKWFSQIKRDGKTYYLGLYDTQREAAAAYKQAVIDHANGLNPTTSYKRIALS